jgi:hypothetical protein
MPVTFNAAEAPRLVRYTFDGEWLASDLIARRLELIGAGLLTTETATLFDLRRATTLPNLAELHSALQEDSVWPMCRAFLVTTQLQYDAARQLQALLGPHSVVNDIFQDEAKALEWLAALMGRAQPI